MHEQTENARRTGYVRRGIGVLVGCSPLFFVAASIVYAMRGSTDRSTGALGVMALALVVACLNFYLSFLRGRIYWRRKHSLDGYRHVSGIPMIGSLLVIVGTLLGFGSGVGAVLGLLAVALDTGGGPWFLIATWKDSSHWDA